MRCAGYAKRKSCADDRIDVPIKEQNDRIREYCGRNGHTLLTLYEDKSDDVMRDNGFEKLKADGMMRKFDFVIVDSIYRFGRTVSNARDLLQMIFCPAGIGFTVLEDGFCSIGKSTEEMDEYFINAIRVANLKPFADKRRKDWENGKFSVQNEKYGYHLSDDRKSFTVDEEAAPIIREIFGLAASGKKVAQIVDYLNERGYESYGSHLKRVSRMKRTIVSDQWHAGAVKTILRTASYKGTGTRTLDGVTYEYEIPEIISVELYDRVQDMLAAKRPKKRKEPIRIENVFTERIKDASTGKSIICHKLEETGELVFPDRVWHPAKHIKYEDVMNAVKEALRLEQEACMEAVHYFDTDECRNYVSSKRDELYQKGRRAFETIIDAEKDNIPLFLEYEKGKMTKEEYEVRHSEILDDIKTRTADLDSLMEEEVNLLKKFSAGNPWIKLYADIHIPKQLDRKLFRKLVEIITVHDFNEIEVRLKNQEWRIYTDKNIGGYGSGKEKQKESK